MAENEKPGYRETYPYVERARSMDPARWSVLDNLQIDRFDEITAGHLVAAGRSIEELDEQLGDTPLDIAALIAPKPLSALFTDYFDGRRSYPQKRDRFRALVRRIRHPFLRSHLAAIAVAGGPYFSGRPAAFPWAVVNRFLRRLASVDGFESVVLRLASDNTNVVTGHFQEILRLYSVAAHRAQRPAALAKFVHVPGLGKTDIDLLTEDGLWVESKRVRGTMALDAEFRAKLDKMGEALRTRAEIRLSTRSVTVTAVHLVNLGRFSRNVHEHAASLGITVQESSVYAFAPW